LYSAKDNPLALFTNPFSSLGISCSMVYTSIPSSADSFFSSIILDELLYCLDLFYQFGLSLSQTRAAVNRIGKRRTAGDTGGGWRGDFLPNEALGDKL
jgi:hypothetical protein